MPRLCAATLLLALLTPALVAAQEAPTARQGVGVGTSYSKGAMERVVQIRARQGYAMRWDLPHIALPDCRLIGRLAWVRAKATARAAWSALTRVQVADCSQDDDWGWHTLWGRRVWTEFDHGLAARWKLPGRFIVEVKW